MNLPFGRLPVHTDFPVNIRRRYAWLYVPLLSWVALVFPLILPIIPIPLGPLVVGICPSTTRRKEFSFFRRSYAYLGQKPPCQGSRGFWRWQGELFTNLLDAATLGLANLFAAAGLLERMVSQYGSAEERAEPAPVAWLLKWLLLGNIVFVALYVLCPGLVLEQILYRLERHMYLHWRRAEGVIPVGDGAVAYRALTSWQELTEASRARPVLLCLRGAAPEDEPAAVEGFRKMLGNLAPDLVSEGLLVGWCNSQTVAPSRYQDLAQHLRSEGISGPAWLYYVQGALAAKRALPPTALEDAAAVANLAREAVGLPQAVVVPRGRVDTPERVICSLDPALQQSDTGPVLVVSLSASQQQEPDQVLEMREQLVPGIREALEARGVSLFVANGGGPASTLLKGQLLQFQGGARGFVLLHHRRVTASKQYGFLWSWAEYVKDINAALQHPVRKELPTTRLRYHVVENVGEAQRLSRQRPVLLVRRGFGEAKEALAGFSKSILPDVCSSLERKGAIICYYKGASRDHRVASNGVTLLQSGVVGRAVEVEHRPGDALAFVAAIRGVLDAL